MLLVGSHVCFGTRTNGKKIVFFWELRWFSVLCCQAGVSFSTSNTKMLHESRQHIVMFLGPVFVCFGLSFDLLQAMTVSTAGNPLNRDNTNKLNPCTQPRSWNWSSWWNSAVVLFFYIYTTAFLLENVNPSIVKSTTMLQAVAWYGGRNERTPWEGPL